MIHGIFRTGNRPLGRALVLATLVMATGWLPVTLGTAIGQSVRHETSLALAPADVGFYATVLRTREIMEDFLNSKAFARLRELPIVQQGIEQIREELEEEGHLDQIQEFFAAPENQELKELLVDAVSHEIFFLGSESLGDLIQIANQISNVMNVAQIEAALEGEDEEAYLRAKMFAFFEQQADKIKVFDLVIGFRVSDTGRADRQLARLETVLREALANKAPELASQLTRATAGAWRGLSLELDGRMLPWDELELDELEVDPERVKKLVERVQQMTVTVSIGRRDRYLILAVGGDRSLLARLGSEPLLVDRPELRPVLAAADRPLTEISYVSGAFLTKAASQEEQLNQLLQLARVGLNRAPIPPEMKDELVADIEKCADWIRQWIPKYEPQVGYEFRVPDGFESFAYDWSQYKWRDGSKPLTILRSLGNPVAFYAARAPYDPQTYEDLVQFCHRIGYYANRLVEMYANPEQQEAYRAIKQDMTPLLKRLDATWRQKLQPAVADGQSAVAVDVQLTSPQWHIQMPRAEERLPFPAIVWLSGLSDVELYKQGGQELLEIANQAIKRLHERYPERIAAFQLPAPEKRETDRGAIYIYPVPPIIGLDPRIAPNVGVGQSVAIWSLAPDVTERLLAARSASPSLPLVEDPSRPLASAWAIEFAGLIDAVQPWINYGFALAGDDVDASVRDQVHTVLDVLRCLRYIRGACYREEDAWVTHVRAGFQDLE